MEGGERGRERREPPHTPPPHRVSRGRERRGGKEISPPLTASHAKNSARGGGEFRGGNHPPGLTREGLSGKEISPLPLPPTPRPPRLTWGEDIRRRGRLSTEKPPRWEREGPHPHGREGLTGPHPPPKVRGRWAPREEKQNNFFSSYYDSSSNDHISLISHPFWMFLGSLESSRRVQPGSDTTVGI